MTTHLFSRNRRTLLHAETLEERITPNTYVWSPPDPKGEAVRPACVWSGPNPQPENQRNLRIHRALPCTSCQVWQQNPRLRVRNCGHISITPNSSDPRR